MIIDITIIDTQIILASYLWRENLMNEVQAHGDCDLLQL